MASESCVHHVYPAGTVERSLPRNWPFSSWQKLGDTVRRAANPYCTETLMAWPFSTPMETVPLELILQVNPRGMKLLRTLSFWRTENEDPGTRNKRTHKDVNAHQVWTRFRYRLESLLIYFLPVPRRSWHRVWTPCSLQHQPLPYNCEAFFLEAIFVVSLLLKREKLKDILQHISDLGGRFHIKPSHKWWSLR